MRSWAKRWNDASLRQIATLPENSSSRPWPLVSMFAIGVIAGAIGCYAVTQRPQIQALARRAMKVRYDLVPFDGDDVAKPASVSSQPANRRRKAVSEVM